MTPMMSRKSRSNTKLGCGYLFWLCLLICGLFIVNLVVVKAFVAANFSDLDFRFRQAVNSTMPVLLIFLQFWIYDMITSGRYQKSENTD